MQSVFSFLYRELKPYRQRLVLSSVLATLAAVLDMLAPVALGRSFDAASRHTAWSVYGLTLIAWFAISLCSRIIRDYLGFTGDLFGTQVAERWYRKTAGRLLHYPLAFHYGKKGQEGAEQMSKMRWTLAMVAGSSLFDFIPILLAATAIVSYLAWMDYRIALIVGTGIAAIFLHGRLGAPKTLELTERRNKVSEENYSFAWDAIRNILVVKSTTSEEMVKKELQKNEKDIMKADRSFFVHLWSKVIGIRDIIVSVASFGAVAVALGNFVAGSFSFGQLTTVTAYTFTIFGYLYFVEWYFRTFIQFSGNLARLTKYLDEKPEDYESGMAHAAKGGVAFEHVKFGYREDRDILDEVTFRGEPGMRIAIVGESGEGKTTLVDLIGRYYEPKLGSVLIDGVDARKINLVSLRSQMAYVPQDLTLFHETLEFNIRYGRPEASAAELHEAARLAQLTDFIESLPDKYKTLVGERGLKLSGGERQRVALARAFLRNPRILILDEPTAHLDSKTETMIQESLRTLMAGRTTFIIAHRLRTVAEADLILVLKDGRIAESGKHDALVAKNGVYAALLKAQGGFITPNEPHL